MQPSTKLHVQRVVLFVTLAALGCAADLVTKQAVFAWRGLPDMQGVWWVWPHYVGIQTALNEGAVFGLFPGKTILFGVLSIAALTFVVYWLFVVGAASDLWQTIALACITAGILGNLYDRLGWWAPVDLPVGYPRHAVRDWILLCYGKWVWPNFNIADSLLVCATGLLMWKSWQEPSTNPEPIPRPLAANELAVGHASLTEPGSRPGTTSPLPDRKA